mgnify:CR=1 FL=1
MAREKLSSRIGFLLLSAGCAIGLGNIWRFPFVTGQSGGGFFVLLYLVFLAILGFPILVMELSIGRAAQRNLVGAYRVLSPGRLRWDRGGMVFFLGNVVLMMFYTTVSGWLLYYGWSYLTGSIMSCHNPKAIGGFFGALTGSAGLSVGWMGLTVFLGMLLCAAGLKHGVEGTVKLMMGALLLLLVVLAVKALTMPGAGAAVKFYLAPNLERLRRAGVVHTVYAAMGQAFFTLSLGVGSMTIFGSYIGKDHSLTKESILIIILDTFVAILAGLIIFPVCFSFGVDVGAGPGLVFLSLPNIFKEMAGGRWWGAAFFIFMSLAAMTTVVAVFENIIAFVMDEWRWKRLYASLLVGFGIFVLSVPCALGFNLWKRFAPMGKGTVILDFEDFLVSQNLLPLGALFVLLFCVSRYGWGWRNFIAEADAGHGTKFPLWLHGYLRWVLPLLILGIFAAGYVQKFVH